MSESSTKDTGILQMQAHGGDEARMVVQTLMLSAHDLVHMGFTRSMAYQLLNRADMPVVQIGARKFMHQELFLDWLVKQAKGASHTIAD